MAFVQALQYTASFLVALGLIVFVHEFGHFATAKAFGMRVFIFSFGFGRRLAGFKWGDTDCRLSLIPLGGYVKLEGEPDDLLSPDDPASETRALSDGTLVRVENPNYFTARPRWQRILVYLAGPFMNVVLTVSVLTVFHMMGSLVDAGQYDRAFVGAVEPGSPAEAAGVRPGDELVSLDGARIDTWEDAQYKILIRPDARLRLGLRRADELREVELRSAAVVDPDMKMKVGHLGVTPLTRLGSIAPGSPAEEVGLRPDDGVLTVDGRPVSSFEEFAKYVNESEGRRLALRVLRGGQVLSVAITPREINGVLRIGVARKEVRRQFGFAGAVRESLVRTWALTRLTIDTLGRLLTGQLSPKSLSGPLGIAKASGEAAERGAEVWFSLVAFISLQVGILNLLPIAPLDGGHLAILGLESVRRRDLTERAKGWILNTGVALLLLLIVVVMWSDLSKTFLGKYMPF